MGEQRSYRILVADDNTHVRNILRKSLQRDDVVAAGARFEVTGVEDGEAAWRLLEQGGFDLVVLDFYMPALDGGSLIARIRSSEKLRTLPVLAVSGESDRREPTLAGGADAFLPKPLRLVDVADAIRTMLRLG